MANARIRALLNRVVGFEPDMTPMFEESLSGIDVVNLPAAGESAAVAFKTPKTAALCYDRVWAAYNSDVPSSVRFYGGSDLEIDLFTVFALSLTLPTLRELAAADGGDVVSKVERVASHLDREAQVIGAQLDLRLTLVDSIARGVCDALAVQYEVQAVPVYGEASSRRSAFKPGDHEVITAMLTDLQVVDETALEWQQVLEFRRDRNARADFRHLSHWLDASMAGKPMAFIQDEIAIRLRNYERAMKKHGLKTVIGMLASTLDSKTLIGGSAAVAALSHAADQSWALAGGAAIVIGTAAVHVARELLDIRSVRDDHAEISFVVEAKRLKS